jgi:hypothetical protein
MQFSKRRSAWWAIPRREKRKFAKPDPSPSSGGWRDALAP